MKKVGFIGAFDKTNFVMCIAKALQLLGFKVLVADATSVQKTRYIVPSINPTKSYITSFEKIDFAVGFDGIEHIEEYFGIKYSTNEEQKTDKYIKKLEDQYDFLLIDVDNGKKFESFDLEISDKSYFVTAFDMFSLRKGIAALQALQMPINLTKILFSYETTKEDEEYLNYISMGYKINWSDYTFYFRILGEDNKVFEENQRTQKIRFKRLSNEFKEALLYVLQDIDPSFNTSQLRKIMRD